MVKRYYAQWGTGDNGNWGWVIYDRQHSENDGDTMAISVCRNKLYAYRIRDALNGNQKLVEKIEHFKSTVTG